MASETWQEGDYLLRVDVQLSLGGGYLGILSIDRVAGIPDAPKVAVAPFAVCDGEKFEDRALASINAFTVGRQRVSEGDGLLC
ncbi:hypothetical protein [Paludibacterium yongneupense]|uniref:hypothetical protein n=1 Tax=Paludibacterium yongneupense TaxID=400061 RepID=UPI000429E526|nr:hypothetical protein [Paludibacterium yongneupense]